MTRCLWNFSGLGRLRSHGGLSPAGVRSFGGPQDDTFLARVWAEELPLLVFNARSLDFGDSARDDINVGKGVARVATVFGYWRAVLRLRGLRSGSH